MVARSRSALPSNRALVLAHGEVTVVDAVAANVALPAAARHRARVPARAPLAAAATDATLAPSRPPPSLVLARVVVARAHREPAKCEEEKKKIEERKN